MQLTKEQKVWKTEIEALNEFCNKEGLVLELRNPIEPQYQIAKLSKFGVSLIVYPHTTKTTRNKHARIRDENSKDKTQAKNLMLKLDVLAGFNCTFTQKWKDWNAAREMRNELEKTAQLSHLILGGSEDEWKTIRNII